MRYVLRYGNDDMHQLRGVWKHNIQFVQSLRLDDNASHVRCLHRKGAIALHRVPRDREAAKIAVF